MLVTEIMSKNVIACRPDDTVSYVLGKMRKHDIHQMPVFDKELKGMAVINNIIVHEFDPSVTKVNSIMVPVPILRPNNTVEDAIELIVRSGVRAVPVFDKKILGIVSEQNLMYAVKPSMKTEDILHECICVKEDDSVATAKKLIFEHNISRVPVVKDGKFVGVVGTLEMIKIISAKQKNPVRTGGIKSGEMMPLGDVSVKTIMRRAVTVNKNTDIKDVVKLLQKSDEVLVEDVLGIITAKDILRNLVRKDMAYVQITGCDEPEISRIYDAAGETIKRITRLVRIEPMKIIVETHKRMGSRHKYSVKVQLPTQIGVFVATKAHGWDLATVSQDAMNNLYREFKKKYDKIRQKSRSIRG